MIKRLEQVAALMVAAGLALVSYWLFFSWAQGGGSPAPPPAPTPLHGGAKRAGRLRCRDRGRESAVAIKDRRGL